MKKIAFLTLIVWSLSMSSFAQEGGLNSCYQTFKSQLAYGHNALAVAMDEGFFVCGFGYGYQKKEYAARAAINQCERNRLNPTNEVQGLRKIMTHCRIYQSEIIE